jgi:hypothetical protein
VGRTIDIARTVGAIDESLVEKLGIIQGLNFPAERLPAITQRLRDLHALAADLDELDLDEVAPASTFDPSWDEDARA